MASTYRGAEDIINLPDRRQENAERCPDSLPIGTTTLPTSLSRMNRIAKGLLAV
jgi:hypothetical protein